MEKQSRKEQILATSYEIVGKGGLEQLHARSVAAELGINHAAVHYYFPKRQDLLVALVEYTQSRFEGDLDRVAANRPTATQRLEAHIALYEAYARPASRFFRVMASLFVAGSAEQTIKEALTKACTAQAAKLKADLEAAKAESGINPNSVFADHEALSGYLSGLCYRSQMMSGMDPTPMIDHLFASLFRR